MVDNPIRITFLIVTLFKMISSLKYMNLSTKNFRLKYRIQFHNLKTIETDNILSNGFPTVETFPFNVLTGINATKYLFEKTKFQNAPTLKLDIC